MYRYKTSCRICGQKKTVFRSPFVKSNENLLCKGCYCVEKRAAGNQSSSNSVRTFTIATAIIDGVKNQLYELQVFLCNGLSWFLRNTLLPCMGPLHLDISANEDTLTNFLPFMRFVYESNFPGKKLADKPKPWQTQFLLEVIIYGTWLDLGKKCCANSRLSRQGSTVWYLT